jgi:ATP-dependent Lhr-like helicase
LDEDFAVESMAGDVFLLGSTAWRFQRIYAGSVRVEDAKGQAPTVPFWRGEAPSRTDELSAQVGRLREDLASRPDALELLVERLGLSPTVAEFLMRYLRAGVAALGGVPSARTVIAERFFDEAGGMQLILHAPFGGRINRAWGLALRKSFCRTFDFELQAAANDDGILLSLGEQHSFPLEEVFGFLSPKNVEEVLVQAVLQTPMFGTRFRWNASRALSLLRYSMGKRVPPQIQRARADDLLAAVFPAQVACQDNAGPNRLLELPDHPLVKETLHDCLREAMDVDGLKEVLKGISGGEIRTIAVDLPEPSVFAHQLLNSQPYTYLDDAPLEERRARAVSVRRTLPAEDAAAFGALDSEAIREVIADAQPAMRDKEEVHEALLQLVLMPESTPSEQISEALVAENRAALLTAGPANAAAGFWVAAERVQEALALFPDASLTPLLRPISGDEPVSREAAILSLVRGWIEISGPITSRELSEKVSVAESEVREALARLESQGQVLRGHFRPPSSPAASPAPGASSELEWCDRRLLQRIHRLTVGRLRKEIQPLSPQDFMRFLFRWHHLDPSDALRGKGGLAKAVSLLEGYEAPAAAWEQVLFPARLRPYLPELLDRASWGGEVVWGRLSLRGGKPAPGPRRGARPQKQLELEPQPVANGRPATPGRNASITFLRREELDWMLAAARSQGSSAEVDQLPADLSHPARAVAEALQTRGASFFQELVYSTRRLPAEVEDALWELLAHGLVTADAVENLRTLQSPKKRKRQKALQRGGPGRWSLLRLTQHLASAEVHEHVARSLLQRYGIVWRDLAMREALAPSWRELLYVYRRLEARGEIRGGRFVSGFAGEQFALPEAVDIARGVRRSGLTGQTICLSAVDPLNLTGIVTPGQRIPSILGNVITYLDGVPTSEASNQDRSVLDQSLAG